MSLRLSFGTLLGLVICSPSLVLTVGMALVDIPNAKERRGRIAAVSERIPEAADAIYASSRIKPPGEIPVLVSFGLSLGFLMAAVMASRLRSNVRGLTEAAEAIACGDLQQPVHEREGSRELRSLSRALEHMRRELQSLLSVTRDNAQRDASLAVAATLSKIALPRESSCAHGPYQVDGFCWPAEYSGGDWWAYEKRDDGSLLVLLGDVSGHGAPSAIVVTAAATAYQVLKQRGMLDDVPQLLGELNRSIAASCGGRFLMTFCALRIDPYEKRAELWNAGGAPALHWDGSEVHPITVSGTPLGAGELILKRRDIPFGPGDQLMVLSDGILEAETKEGRQFGLRRMCALFRRHAPSRNAEQMARSVRAATEDFADDDRSFVLVSWPPEA